MRRFTVMLLTLVLLVMPAKAAAAGEHVALHVAFKPDEPGASTTIVYGFNVTGLHGSLPAPLTNVDLHLPANMGLARSNLGLATCESALLAEDGPEACSAEARVGHGVALVQVDFGGELLQETATITALFGPPNNENLVVLFYAEGRIPLASEVVFPGEVLPDSGQFGEQISTAIPLRAVDPGGPDVAVVQFTSTIGPMGISYYRHIRGELVPYEPKGISVPLKCPKGGFPFRGNFTFADGTHVVANTSVRCPTTTHHDRTRHTTRR